MIRRIEYPHITDSATPLQVKGELFKLVDQINVALAEVEHRLESKEGGKTNAD